MTDKILDGSLKLNLHETVKSLWRRLIRRKKGGPLSVCSYCAVIGLPPINVPVSLYLELDRLARVRSRNLCEMVVEALKFYVEIPPLLAWSDEKGVYYYVKEGSGLRPSIGRG